LFLVLLATIAVLLGAMLSAWIWALMRLASGRELVPETPPRAAPWDAWAIALVVSLQLILGLAVGAIHHAVTGRSGMPPATTAAGSGAPAPAVATTAETPAANPRTFQDLLVIQAFAYLLTLVLVPILLHGLWGARLADLGLGRRGAARNLARGGVGFLLVAPVCYAIFIALQHVEHDRGQPHPLVRMLMEDFSPRTLTIAVLTGIVLAPLAEELLFRGVVLGSLERLGEGPPDDAFEPREAPSRGRARGTLPNVLTSVLFAALHYAQWPAPVPLFVLSLVLGWLRRRTGSLWAPVALHACFNGTSTLLLVLVLAAGGRPDNSSPFGAVPPTPGAVPTMHVCISETSDHRSIFGITPLESAGRTGNLGGSVAAW
jgi:membrane protease YdiL (CAAX protease family)